MKSIKSTIRQSGLTLIEIMVALVIGMVLLAGMLQIFISNKQTYRIQENLSRLQENGRFAMDYFNRYLRLAGYMSVDTLTNIRYTRQSCGTKLSYVFTGPNTVIAGTNDAGLNNSDTITVSFQGERSPQMRDCLGNTIGNNNGSTIAVNQFLLANDPDTSQPSLYCDPQHSDGTNAARQLIVEGIENIQILYGEATPTTMRYVPAGDVNVMKRVDSVRIKMVLRTAEDNLTDRPQPYRFDTNNDGVDELITPNDWRLRRVFTTTVALRNLVGCPRI